MRSLVIMGFLILTQNSCKLMNKKEEEKEKPATSAATKFKTVEWAHGTNIYEVNLRQYTREGTLNAFAQELPRLKAMGVETLWFMPITPISRKNMKGMLGSYYACSDYTSVNPEFGTLDDFKTLVKQAHDMGMKVIIDWVANHTGWEHTWTKEHPEYYLVDSATKDFQIASGMDDIIELDFSKPELRRAMIDAMKFWVTQCDIDGFRADLAFWVELDFWKEARAELEPVKPLFWLGEYDELDNPDYAEVFDASYTWRWMHRAKDFYQNKLPLDSLLSVLNLYDKIGDGSMRAWFTTNHDENSWNGTEYEKYGDMARALAVFSCTWNGVPLLYSGQELPNKKRLKFFERDPIEWTGKNELDSFYRSLLKQKRDHPALRGGDARAATLRIQTSHPGSVLCYLRKNGEREVFVIMNLSSSPLSVSISDSRVKGVFTNTFSPELVNDFDYSRKFELAAWEAEVYQK
jgi:alpha-amylase